MACESSFTSRRGEVFDAIVLIALDRPLLLAAGGFAEPALRTLDAIHLAAAVEASPLDAFVSDDKPSPDSPVSAPSSRVPDRG